MNILSIETSCDDTAVALVKVDRGRFIVLDEYVSSQTKVHSPFGGVVPNLASREHLKNLPLLLKKIIAKNKIKPQNIDFVAVTEGPGLIPALLIGTNAAKALAYAWKKPLVGVHHIAGHIYANFLQDSTFDSKPFKNSSRPSFLKFPILALIVSGGHTELIFMKKHIDFKIIGQTLDDAAGEAFDKVAKILGLGYPGGPIVSKLAGDFQTSAKARLSIQGSTFSPPTSRRSSSRSNLYSLPRPMINSDNFNFSFSGLKTAALYTIRDNPIILRSEKLKSGLCAEFQQAVIDVLVSKTIRAAKKYQPKTILLGGGVSANKELRRQLGETVKNTFPDTKYQIPAKGEARQGRPAINYSLDNAAMIAAAGYFKFRSTKNKRKFHNNWKILEADANLKLM